MKARMILNFSLIPPPTTELAALERLNKSKSPRLIYSNQSTLLSASNETELVNVQTVPKLGVDYILLEDYFLFEPDILLVH